MNINFTRSLVVFSFGGMASDAQIAWVAALRAQGYWAEVVEGWVAAARKICLYLGFELRELGL